MNKVDLVQQLDDVICISAKHNIGKQALLTTLMPEDKALGADAISVRASQLDALRRVKASVMMPSRPSMATNLIWLQKS